MAPVESSSEFVLTSKYPAGSLPKLSTTSAAEFILSRAKQNVLEGRNKWVTNTRTGEEIKLDVLEPLSRKVASALLKRGMKPGDVALHMTSNVTKIYTVIIGAWRIGGILYSSYPEDTHDTLLMRIEESNARWIFCDPESVPQCREAIAMVDWSVEIFVFGEVEGTTSVEELFEDDGLECPEKVPNPGLDEPLFILCTSGTTGPSKGAVYTNRTLLGFFMSNSAIPKVVKLPVFLMRSTHVLGLCFPMRNALMGFGCAMMDKITNENLLKCVHTYKPAIAFGFPTFLMALATDPKAKDYDLSSLEIVVTGGMAVTENFYEAMHTLPNMKHVINGFGLTECGTVTSTVDLRATDEIRTIENIPKLTVGLLLPNMALKVLDQVTGKTLGPNQKGELVVKSPIMASGYWKRPEATASTFVDGWMMTGDRGYYDEEGFIFIEDRIKETFKYYNNHISPTDLEARILQHPAVADVTVFGIKDPLGGDHIPRALVILKPDATSTAKEIRNFAEQTLAVYKHFRGGLYIVDSLPRGTTGKVIKSLAAKIPLPEND